MQSEGNMSLKNPVTPPGINPGTVRLVSQHLNHYATPGPSSGKYLLKLDRELFCLMFILHFLASFSLLIFVRLFPSVVPLLK